MIVNHLRVEDICDFIGGSQPAKAEFINEPKEGYVRLIQTRDYKTDAFPTYIPEKSTRKFCDEDDVMIGRYGPPIFQICRGLKGAYNVALLKAKPKKGIDREFLYYFLKQDAVFKYVDKLSARTGGQTGVDLVSLNKYPVRVPTDIDDQEKLVASLVAIDKKIELNNRINAELEAMAKTLYDYWFVQFDFPDDSPQGQGKPYKTSGGKMVYNPTLKREIPEGWEVKTFGDYSKVKSGFAFKSSWWQEKGIPVLKIKDIQENNSLDQNNLSFVSAEKIDVARKFICKKHDVVIAMTGATIGKFAVIPHMEKPLLVNQRVGLYDLGAEPINRLPFLLNSMKQPIFREKIFQLAGGAAQPNISGDQLDKIPLIHPPHFIVDDFNSKLSYQYSMYCNLESENQKLIELRDWLLPMLMNGQVTVGEAS